MSSSLPITNQELRLELSSQYPDTRYMGSKRKMLGHIASVIEDRGYASALDAFSGTGCVGYMFKELGLEVTTNDFLKFGYDMAHAAIENSHSKLSEKDIELLMAENSDRGSFILDTFGERYFSIEDSIFLENLIANINLLTNEYKRSLALASAHRACLKRRPRGVFTYVGTRYTDGRKDLKLSLREHFLKAAAEWNQSIFDNGKNNRAYNVDVYDIPEREYGLVYLDPPYLSRMSDNDYTRRYHFVEGLSSYWRDHKIQEHTQTKKIESRKTPFGSKLTIHDAFDRLFAKFASSDILLSYSSTGIPSREELITLLKKHKKKVDVIEVDYQYSFGTHKHIAGNVNNKIKEYLFLAT